MNGDEKPQPFNLSNSAKMTDERLIDSAADAAHILA